jgi:hypothetical protein
VDIETHRHRNSWACCQADVISMRYLCFVTVSLFPCVFPCLSFLVVSSNAAPSSRQEAEFAWETGTSAAWTKTLQSVDTVRTNRWRRFSRLLALQWRAPRAGEDETPMAEANEGGRG